MRNQQNQDYRRGQRDRGENRSYSGGDKFGSGRSADDRRSSQAGGSEDFGDGLGRQGGYRGQDQAYQGQSYSQAYQQDDRDYSGNRSGMRGQSMSETDHENFEREHYWSQRRGQGSGLEHDQGRQYEQRHDYAYDQGQGESRGYGQYARGQQQDFGGRQARQDSRERSDWDQQGGSMYENRYRAGMSGSRPQHRKGPKNYTRSDERIKEDLCERLTDAYDLEVENVSIEVKDGTVTITGSVPERSMKHRIEDIACACSGIKDVENQVRVSSSGANEDDSSAGTRGSSQASQASQPGKKREH